MAKLKYPLADVVQYLRGFVLSVDKKIGEGIFYNAPTFYYTGKMKPFDPKEYKRYIVGCNLFRKDTLRVIFLRGASASDPTCILQGDYKDGRRLTLFKSIEDVKKSENALRQIIKELINKIHED